MFGRRARPAKGGEPVPASAKCMIDEGNGRCTPCEALYKTKKPVAKTRKAKTMKHMKMKG
jgi:hypothetical protein